MMAFQNTPAEPLRLKGLTLTALPAEHFAARFDLLLSLTEEDGGITGSLQYKEDLFDATTAERMVEHYRTLLEGAAADPQQPISRLPLLSERERKQQLEEWNATAAEYPRHRCVHDLFEEQVERTPDAVAVVDARGEVTYGELNRRANQLAHHLRGMGVSEGQSVGVCVERSVESALAALAVLKAGGVYVPLEVESGPERLQQLAEDAGLGALVTRQRFVASWPGHVAKTVLLDADMERVAQAPTYNPSSETDEGKAACVLYESTAAGKSTGAVISHQALLERLFRTRDTYRLGASDGVLRKDPFGPDPAPWEIFRPLLSGGRLVMARSVGSAPLDEEGAEGAETLVEELVALIWGELLGREVGRDANFFEVGGDEHSWARMLGRVREVFGVDLGPRLLSERPTLGGLSALIEERMIEEAEKVDGSVLT
jgi:non-ribosomal peptide synthetase component F